MNYVISHSVKGSTWKNHKYVTKIGNRYVYKDDQKRRRERISANYKGDTEKLDYISNQQALADMNRPLTAVLQKNGLQLWDNIVNALTPNAVKESKAKKEELQKKIEDYESQIRLKDREKSKEQQERRQKMSTDYKQAQIRNSVAKVKTTIENSNKKKTLVSPSMKQYTDNQRKRQQAKSTRSTNFRYRISKNKSKA